MGYLQKTGRNVVRVVRGQAKGGPLGGRRDGGDQRDPRNVPGGVPLEPGVTHDSSGEIIPNNGIYAPTDQAPQAQQTQQPAPMDPVEKEWAQRAGYTPDEWERLGPQGRADARREAVAKEKASAAAKAAASAPVVPAGTFADTSGIPAQIMALRQRALQGMSDTEEGKARESFLTGIQGTLSGASSDLARRQSASGVTGGVAFAQQQALNNAALGARAGAERDLYMRDMDLRRKALDELQGYTGSERYGNIASILAGRQLGMQQSAQDQNAQYQQDLLEAIRGQQTGTLPPEDRTGPSLPSPAVAGSLPISGGLSTATATGIPAPSKPRKLTKGNIWWQPKNWDAGSLIV